MNIQAKERWLDQVDGALPRIAIVMATYNGARYLREQIDSICKQGGVSATLFVYDDCSTDDTLNILESLSAEYGALGMDIHVQRGERNVGFPTSFFCALRSVCGDFDYYAYADQDDVWKEDKLAAAVAALGETDGDARASLYFEPTTSVDERLNYLFERKLGGLNLSLQSFFVRARVAAHTMVFDEGMKRELCRLGVDHNGFSHGWLALLIAAAIKGRILVGETSHTLHRRLDSSVSAGGKGFLSRIAFEWGAIFDPEVNRAPMAKILLDNYKGTLTCEEAVFLKNLAGYKESATSKFRLLNPKNYRTDIAAANAEAALSILFSRY